MGGSGGSWEYTGGSRGGSGPVDSCEITFTTTLLSPNPAILPTIKVGDRYEVRFISPSGPLALVTPSGHIIGSIVNLQTHKLIDCIQKGNHYIGTIKDLNGGTCEIHIKNGTI